MIRTTVRPASASRLVRNRVRLQHVPLDGYPVGSHQRSEAVASHHRHLLAKSSPTVGTVVASAAVIMMLYGSTGSTAVDHPGTCRAFCDVAWTPTPGLLLMDFDDATFDRVLATNLWATFYCMQLAQPHMVARGRGAIINFASGSGTRGNETQGAYAAAKEGIRGLSRTAAREWGPLGIRVNLVCPFANSPGMIDWANLDPAGHAAAIEEIPLRRVGDCHDDVGRVCVFLASDDADYVTAQTMWVDGGSGTTR